MIQNSLLALFATLLFSNHALAYVDPNSGFVLWQLLMGAFMGSLLFAKRIWNFVKRKKNP